jgi:hypothetical protein
MNRGRKLPIFARVVILLLIALYFLGFGFSDLSVFEKIGLAVIVIAIVFYDTIDKHLFKNDNID